MMMQKNKHKNIVEEIRRFVEEACKKPTNIYTYDVYTFHIVPVWNYAKKLSEKLNVDKELVELAALLHDIGLIMKGRENHHITGVKIAEEKLKELNYPKDKIELIKKCILNHRGSVDIRRGSVEEQIIADADSMSHFNSIGGLFKVIYLVYKKEDQKEANDFLKQKYINSWNKLSLQESKELIKPKYDAAMLLLK